MKISTKQLRRIIREALTPEQEAGMKDFGAKFDQQYKQPDGSYSGHPDESPSNFEDEIILDYEKVASDETEYIIDQLKQGGVSVRPGGVEVFEDAPGMVSVAVSDEDMLNAVIDILGEPLQER